ncbi:hypothetical protein ABNQ39_00380 (plasmid) [Azospirillum sp. A26]|uniref:hypothetical protein n=1 Tax=Azospirillum sp. A26 TaxID=3160607 RepID=UPI0036721B3A
MATKNPRKNVMLTPWQARRVEELSELYGSSESDVMRMLIGHGLKRIDTTETLLARLREEGFERAVDILTDHPLAIETTVNKSGITVTLTDDRRLIFPRHSVPAVEVLPPQPIQGPR